MLEVEGHDQISEEVETQQSVNLEFWVTRAGGDREGADVSAEAFEPVCFWMRRDQFGL